MPAAYISLPENGISGLEVTQDAHNFFVHTPIYQQADGTWVASQSNDFATLATDIVAEVIDENTFRRAYDGEEVDFPDNDVNYTPGTPMGDSAQHAGILLEFDSQSGRVLGSVASNVLGYASGATSIIFRKERAIS